MGDKGNLGIELDLDQVPTREDSMTAYEMMLSESQERMLMVLNPDHKDHAKQIFEKWGLDFAIIGKTIKNDKFRVFHNGQLMADVPLKALSGLAPEYDRPWINPARAKSKFTIPNLNPLECLKKLIASPNYCSRARVWQQYDSTILSNTIIGPGSDAALVKIDNSNKAIALTCDVTPRYCFSDPYEGGKQAVAESFRNIISSGATPLAITDNLNFGNPEKPEIMGQIVMSIKGISEAAKTLNMPVVSGNVSLYNETNGIAILPTPTIGAVGILSNYKNRIIIAPKNGQVLLLVGELIGHLGQSSLTTEILNLDAGGPPIVDLRKELNTGQLLLQLNNRRLIKSSHDLSDGGLVMAAAEMALGGEVGVTLRSNSLAFLFGEEQSRYIISCHPKDEVEIIEAGKMASVPIINVGSVGGQYFSIGDNIIPFKELRDLYENGLNSLFH